MSNEVYQYFPNTIAKDALSVFIGELIANGSTRNVYRSIDPKYVVKFETSAKRFQNVLEWEIWQIAKLTKYRPWFAPCIDIGDCGTVLIQAYCRNLEDNELPEDVPAFFADVKRENFGMYEGHVVCRDYGNTWLMDRGFNNRMKKAEW